MKEVNFTFINSQNESIFVHHWRPRDGVNPKAVVMIAHGMAEHAARYQRFAKALTQAGYSVYAEDHRGHGRSAGERMAPGDAGPDSFEGIVQDLRLLHQIAAADNPGLSVFLFGHSFGSFLAQKYIYCYGDTLKGVVLSGTSGKKGLELNVGILLARLEMIFKGYGAQSRILHNLSFASYNRSFRPNRTPFDWLSRDRAEVDRYVADPLCGTVFSAGFYYDMFRGLKEIHRVDNMRKISPDLPIHIIAGTRDPLGNATKSVKWLMNAYRKLGIKDLSHTFYPDGRHEMLNEINRDEVTADLIQWLDRHCKQKEEA